MPADDGRRLCVILLSCVGVAPKYLLPFSDDFHRQFKLVSYVNNNAPTIPAQLENILSELQQADVLIHHSPEWLPFLGDQYERYETSLDSLPQSLLKVSYPLPLCHFLWPFHANEPRNDDPHRPLNRHGTQPFYHYGDSHILELLKQGAPAERVIEQYVSLKVDEVVDLDALKAMTLGMTERCDRTTTVKVADFFEANIRSQKLFQTINHIGNNMHVYMADEVLKALGCGPLPAGLRERTRELIGEPLPIHPSVARYFGLTYADETTRYPIDEHRNLTFSEYIRAYVNYE